jgi:predicted PurR-regulated permease PerM
MEISQISLNQGLTFLAWASGVIIVIMGVFLIKLLIDLSTLTKNLNTTSTILNTELQPTLKELNETLASVNAIVKSTDQGVDTFKHAIEKTFGKTKSIISGIIQGFTTIFSALKK